MVMRQGLLVTGVGIGVGLVGALALSRLMASMLFHVSPLEPRVLGGAVLFMAVVAGIAGVPPGASRDGRRSAHCVAVTGPCAPHRASGCFR